jgi:hypothetical protein
VERVNSGIGGRPTQRVRQVLQTAPGRLLLIACAAWAADRVMPALNATQPLSVVNAAGLRLAVADEHDLPALRISVPRREKSDPGIFVLFPEHVTVREKDVKESRAVYFFNPGRQAGRPTWRLKGRSLEYDWEVAPGVQMLARATLEEDGVRYYYRFANGSALNYAMVQAVTDPRMVSPYFRDVRLERTYVHHDNGFELLASETPGRVALPLDQWLPNRHRVSYTWPIERERVSRQDEGVTWHNKSRRVDEPLIATKSIDDKWVMATFSYDPGNVWVNPELTCQHADPQIGLGPEESGEYELKTLLFQGTLDQALARVKEQRPAMKR